MLKTGLWFPLLIDKRSLPEHQRSPAPPWRSVLSPVIHAGELHSKMSNGCLMGAGEASINLIADH